MAFKATEKGALAVMRWHLSDKYWSNFLWFKMDEFDTTDMQALADTIANLSYENLHLIVAEDVHGGKVYVYDERTQGQPMVESAGDEWYSNTDHGDALPFNVNVVATLRTAKRGRSYRGRNYWAGFGEAQIAGGVFDGAISTALLAFYDDLKDGAETLGWTWGVRSAQVGGELREFALIEPITSYVVRSLVPGSQRRRTPRI